MQVKLKSGKVVGCAPAFTPDADLTYFVTWADHCNILLNGSGKPIDKKEVVEIIRNDKDIKVRKIELKY